MCLFGNDLDLAAKHLRQLADDLDMISSGGGPTDEHLAPAPELTNWRPQMSARGQAAIGGNVNGDEHYDDGQFVYVEIVAADPDCKWIRSLLGWYRLGIPGRKMRVAHA
jgi:hypothetical protein